MNGNLGRVPTGLNKETRKKLGKSVAVKLADRLLARRKVLGFSQQELSALAGINTSSVKRMEKGEGDPMLSLIEAVATALRVQVSELIG